LTTRKTPSERRRFSFEKDQPVWNFLTSDVLWIKWAVAGGIVGLALLLAFLSKYILGGVVRPFTKKTKTILDDLIVESLTAPVFAMLIAGGLWIAITRFLKIQSYEAIVHKIFIIIFIVIAGVAVSRIIHAILRWYTVEIAPRTKSEFDDRLVPLLSRVADIIVYSFAFLIILGRLNINIAPYLAGLGIGGLAVALALQPTLTNFLSGTYVISDSIIRKGDYIQLDSGLEGTVEEIGWRITKIRHWQGNLVILPNTKLSDAVVTDFEKPETSMIFSVDGGVSYNSDLENVERIISEVAAEVMRIHPEGGKNFAPVVRFKNFGDSNINFSVVLKADNRAASFALKHYFIKALHKRFQDEGIVMEFPVRKLYFDNNAAAGMLDQKRSH
jgi:small-conductance mechanosensitive channel